MQTPSTKAKMLFLQGALPVFTRLNLKLQQEGPMVHRLMDECEQATKTILLNVLRPEAVLSASSLASIHLLRQQNFLDLTKVTIGTATERYTERVFRSTDSKAEFLELCRDFWVVAAKEAQAHLPLKDGVLKAASFLEPLRGSLIDGSTLVSLAKQFPPVIPSDQLDELRRQWQEYQVDAEMFLLPMMWPTSGSMCRVSWRLGRLATLLLWSSQLLCWPSRTPQLASSATSRKWVQQRRLAGTACQPKCWAAWWPVAALQLYYWLIISKKKYRTNKEEKYKFHSNNSTTGSNSTKTQRSYNQDSKHLLYKVTNPKHNMDATQTTYNDTTEYRLDIAKG